MLLAVGPHRRRRFWRVDMHAEGLCNLKGQTSVLLSACQGMVSPVRRPSPLSRKERLLCILGATASIVPCLPHVSLARTPRKIAFLP